jgi:hypothetical protein
MDTKQLQGMTPEDRQAIAMLASLLEVGAKGAANVRPQGAEAQRAAGMVAGALLALAGAAQAILVALPPESTP